MGAEAMQHPARYAALSILAALVTLGLKGWAWAVTGSVGLLSDALESLVNLAAALLALAAVMVALRPPDEGHAYGHEKAEYFSSGVEGTLIVVAALAIAVSALDRLLHPRPLEQLGLGLGVAAAAALVNLGTAVALGRAARVYRSIALEASSRHLLADVWTSAGVLLGVGVVGLTGWTPLDPLLALLVAGQVVVAGFALIRRSVQGLMDASLPAEDLDRVRGVLERHAPEGVGYHALRSRVSGRRSFVSVHVLVPGDWTVSRGHALLETLESEVRESLPGTTLFTHLEPAEEAVSWEDVSLDRGVAS